MTKWILVAGLLLPVQTAEFESTATVSELMTAMIIPSSNVVGNAGLNGDPTEEEWAEIERQALILAESGNLLLLPDRAQGRADWIQASKDMITAGQAALEAARAKNAEPLMLDIGGAIFDSCTACHDQYFN